MITRRRVVAVLVVVFLVWLVLVMYIVVDEVYCPPTSPLETPEHVIFMSPVDTYLPMIVREVWVDKRFGVAEEGDMARLGFPDDGRFHAQQWGMPECSEERCDTVIFSRTDNRCLKSNCGEAPKEWPSDLYCLFVYEIEGKRGNCTGEVATRTGLLNSDGLCEFLQDHPDISIIVGNEEAHTNPGISDGVTPQEYTDWYREVWTTVKACAPSVKVGPYGPMHWSGAQPFLLDFWEAYGGPVPMDFMSVHHYAAWPNFVLQDEIDSLLAWKTWLDSHVDAPEWILSEYALPCWKSGVPNEGPEVERFMTDFTCWLLSTGHFQSWAWWPSCWLYRNGQRTVTGELYLSMAQQGCVTTVGDLEKGLHAEH